MSRNSFFQLPEGVEINVNKNTVFSVLVLIIILVAVGALFSRNRSAGTAPQKEESVSISGVITAVDQERMTVSISFKNGFFGREKTVVSHITPETNMNRELIIKIENNPTVIRNLIPIPFSEIHVGDSISVVPVPESYQTSRDDFAVRSLVTGPFYIQYPAFLNEVTGPGVQTPAQ